MKKSKENLVFWGVLMLLVAVFGRCFTSLTLNDVATRFMAKYTAKQMTSTFASWQPQDISTTLTIPTWLGWSCLCIGGLLILESFVTPKEA